MNRELHLTQRFISSLLTGIFLFSFSQQVQANAVPLSPQGAGDYTFEASIGTYSELTDPTVSTATGEDGIEDITLPFVFYFDSLAYTKARISVHGWLELGQVFSGPTYVNDLANPEARSLLAPFWDSLYDDDTSEVRYQTLGTSPDQVFIVEWKDILWAGSAGTRQNFQLWIYEGSNRIEFVYGQMNNSTNTSASIGITDPIGGSNHFISVTPGDPPVTSNTVANNDITNIDDLPEGTTYSFIPACFNLWTGTVDQDWHKNGNWNCSVIPGEGDNASIPDGTINDPAITSDATLAILGIEPGASMSLNGGNLSVMGIRILGELVVSDGETITVSGTTAAWDRDPNSGVFQNGNGLVIFSGSGTLTTRAPEIFHNLRIDSGKSFDPHPHSLQIEGTFTNQGTFWPSGDTLIGNVFGGTVVNEAVWRQRNAIQTFNSIFTNTSTATFNTSSDTVSGTVFNMDATNNGVFNASDTGILVMRGNWINNGTFTPGTGTFILGKTGDQYIQDITGTNTFYNLQLLAGSRVLPLNNVDVIQILTINYGAILDLNEILLTVSSDIANSGDIAQVKTVLPEITTEFLNIKSSTGTQVYWGVDITSSTNLGKTRVVIKGNQPQGCTKNSTDQTIKRCYTISPQTPSPSTVKFYFRANELNRQSAIDLKLWHYEDGWNMVGVNYTYSTTCSGGQRNCWMQAEEISTFSPFTLGSGGTPTAVKITDFKLSSGNSMNIILLLLSLSGSAIFFYLYGMNRKLKRM